jgi:DnaJ-class molecular chaperone
MSKRTRSGGRYQILGLTNVASQSEIRRAYRILARRYHPDLNPNTDTGKIFREIAEAYAILSDPDKRRQYDMEISQLNISTHNPLNADFEESFLKAEEALKRKHGTTAYNRAKSWHEPKAAQNNLNDKKKNRSEERNLDEGSDLADRSVKEQNNKIAVRAIKIVDNLLAQAASKLKRASPDVIAKAYKSIQRFKGRGVKSFGLKTAHSPESSVAVSSISLVELSISMHDAIHGAKRTVELSDQPENIRKLSVAIPPGVATGSVVRLRNKNRAGEEIALIIKVERHPWLSITERGLTMEIPLTITEAIEGTKIQVPSFGDPLLVTVEAGTKSGKEVRLKGQGITLNSGLRGDLYLRFIVGVPLNLSADNIAKLKEALTGDSPTNVRTHLPKSLVTLENN